MGDIYNTRKVKKKIYGRCASTNEEVNKLREKSMK
jgi:hypothetical protein